MSEIKFPAKVSYPRGNGKPPKVLVVASQGELNGFLRCGWTLVEPEKASS